MTTEPPLPAVITDDEDHALSVLKERKGRPLRARLKRAIDVYVTEGLSIADSARRAGMTPHSLQVALKKPHVQEHVTHVKRAWMDNRTSKAWTNIAELADKAQSEDVRLKANRVFLEAAGELGGKDKDQAGLAKALVQIIVNQAQPMAQPLPERLSGVIEAEPFQLPSPHPSNSNPVGRADSDEDDED